MARVATWLATPVILLILLILLILPILALPAASQAAGRLLINDVDPAGVGFNDPTPIEPVGGNAGETLGEQRMIAFRFAADAWASLLDAPVDIVVQASFRPLPCDIGQAVLGAAAALRLFANFPGAPLANTWYHAALANALAGYDLTPGPPDPGLLAEPYDDDIVAVFNAGIDRDEDCLSATSWYYGLDHEAGGGIDLVNVLMHELAHGLGFSSVVDEHTGAGPLGMTGGYELYVRDGTSELAWDQLDDAGRVTSARNSGRLLWAGENVFAKAPDHLARRPELVVSHPESAAGVYEVDPADFGRKLGAAGPPARVVMAVPADACVGHLDVDFDGAIALVDRGGCTFTVKATNAEAAGASAVLVVNDHAATPTPVGGSSSGVSIVVAGISGDVGERLKAALPSVEATLGLSESRLAGADDEGFVRLYAPDPVEAGSSVSHWDTAATPDLVMEPFISPDLAATEDLDLTVYALADMGWTLRDPDGACVAKGGYDDSPCGGDAARVTSLADYDAYVASDYGRADGGHYKDVEIAADVVAPAIDIASPCRLRVAPGTRVHGDTVRLRGRRGVDVGERAAIGADASACLLSRESNVTVGSGAWLAAETVTMSAAATASLDPRAEVRARGDLMMLARGVPETSRVRIGADARLWVGGAMKVLAHGRTVVESGARVRVVGPLYVQAATDRACQISDAAAVSAAATSGNCSLP